MTKNSRPKVNIFPDEDTEWGGYKDAVQCIYCRRWMVIDFERTYLSSSGTRHHIIQFKELCWDGYNWYISNRSHNPNICGHAKENKRWAKEQGYKNWGQFKRIIKQESSNS